MAEKETYTVKNGKATIPKDSNATLDYPFDWSEWLDDIGDTIASAEAILDPADLTLEIPVDKPIQFDTKHVVIWVKGGSVPPLGQPNARRITCRVTTVGGRTDDRSIFLKIVER